jgi:hypothetical protein
LTSMAATVIIVKKQQKQMMFQKIRQWVSKLWVSLKQE